MSYLFFLTSAISFCFFFFFFNDTATTEIYTLSLHDALPILFSDAQWPDCEAYVRAMKEAEDAHWQRVVKEQWSRSEEHTSELQSLAYLVCRLLLEKKKHNVEYTICREQRLPSGSY